ncbi:sialoadhesin-like, partial [Salvelinus fontinalis]|uniref:sialoadhesin-like n=1 Tax=Salvelinus fontinalis TaxID=8038 RepID=UPI00248624B1
CSTTCTLTDNPTYIWYRNGQRLHEPVSQQHSSNLLVVWDSSVNIYSCAVEGHEDLHSPVVYKPKNTSVSVSPSGEIVEGSSVTLTCSSDANPPVQSYTWWYKKNGGEYQSMTGPQHVFNQIQSSDTGEYYCEAQNEMGTDRSRTINMDVKFDPKNTSVSVSPSGEIVEGSSVTLTCSSDANPPVDKYTWYKNNGASLTGSEKTYHFTTISSEDSGEYYCEAENKNGRLNSSFVSVDSVRPDCNSDTYTALNMRTMSPDYDTLISVHPDPSSDPNSDTYTPLNMKTRSPELHPGTDGWSVTYTTQSICALKWSTVELSCSYTYTSGYIVITTFWFTKNDAEGNPVTLSDDPDYTGHVMYSSNKTKWHTLTIRDLREAM